MRLYFPLIFSSLLGLGLLFTARLFLRRFNSKYWQHDLFGKMAHYLPVVVPLAAAIWAAGIYTGTHSVLIAGASVLALANLLGSLLLVTLPFSLLMARIPHPSKLRGSDEPVSPDRRRFLKTAATALPVVALGTASTGMAASFEAIRIPHIPLKFDGLDPRLDGVKILQLSDLHLGVYLDLDNLSETLRRAEAERPDLLLVTGDLADNLSLLPDALKLIDQFPARYGSYFALGNHEYIRGIRDVLNYVHAGPVPLLKDEGLNLKINGADLWLAGADDPRTLRADIIDFLEQTGERALDGAPSDAFRLLMSHRPRALDTRSGQYAHLILGGHTHGGQVGFNGRSMFEGMIEKEPYMWGVYRKNGTTLYTSSGMGHWFPFRFNCPAEAPLIELKKA